MEGRDQRALAPGSAAAPGRVQHDVVEAGAQCVVSRAKLFQRHALVARLLLENPDLANGSLIEVAGIRRACRIAQARHELEQRRGGDRKHVAADRHVLRPLRRHSGALRQAFACPMAAGRFAQRSAVRAAGVRRRPGVGRMTVRLSSSGSAKGLSLMLASRQRRQPRIAQSSILRFGNSPERWMAKPPEDCSSFQCVELRSSSK